jgi:ABC-type antimicrobial peptide transport system permease subunit
MVLREALVLAVVGVAIGLPAAWVATRFISSMLYGLKSTDPATVLAATLLMAAVAVLAGYFPARRASRVDPMVALRYE